MATVFDVFKEVQYDYLVIAQSQILGDTVADTRTYTGIFKDRAGMAQSGNMEAANSTATMHVHPEDFPEANDCSGLIGNGVNVNGQDYSIVGATAGTNFETGEIEHYRLTLQKADFARSSNE